MQHLKKSLIAATFALATSFAAQAADPIKIGLVLPMTGPFAAYGKQIEHGVKLYLSTHGDSFAGRKVELIVKDDSPGTAGDVSKRLAQELVVKDKVDILAGFGLTPSAFAVAPVATEAKKPMVVMNAATSAVTTKSNYLVRTSMTLPQITAPIASWAAKNKIKKVFTLVADYGPGHDAEGQFKKTFTAAGGEIVGEVRAPVKNPDFAPFLQKIKDTKPDAVATIKEWATANFNKSYGASALLECFTDEELRAEFKDLAAAKRWAKLQSEQHASAKAEATA